MSGSKVLLFPQPEATNPLAEKLRIEDDRRLFRCAGAGSLIGAAFAAWALSVDFPSFQGGCHLEPGGESTIVHPGPDFGLKPIADYHGKISEKRIARHHAKEGQKHPKAPIAKTAHPTQKPGWLGQNLVTSRNSRRDLGAYDLLHASLKHVDMEKLTELPMLRRTSDSRIAGRRGKESHEFNFEYSEQGTGCGADCGSAAFPDLPSPERLKPRGPSAMGPRVSSIDYASAENTRSSAAILAIIRSHAPGLRHAYNGYLKRLPGMAGKLNLAFSISPGGDVLELAVVSSTTGAPDFDAEIARLVKAWRFDPVKAVGNDHVTVPFTFSE
jgi:TonB family protein